MHAFAPAPTIPLPVATPDDMAYYERSRPDTGVRLRILFERAIVRKAAQALIAAGFEIAIHNGEAEPTIPTGDLEALMASIMATDVDEFWTYKAGQETGGWIRFHYGNSGWDVMSNYTVDLADALKPVHAYADALAAWC